MKQASGPRFKKTRNLIGRWPAYIADIPSTVCRTVNISSVETNSFPLISLRLASASAAKAPRTIADGLSSNSIRRHWHDH